MVAKASGSDQPVTEGRSDADSQLPICGMVRPIADMGANYPATHWAEVHEIVAEAAGAAGYRLRLVSESDQAGIIVSQIVNNLYSDPIVICDVSARNPNVMFELGMRITFQKPVIIITDYETPFSFDITPVKHLQYRRDLRLGAMRKFQSDLKQAVIATVEAAKDPSHRDYLQQFGPIEVTGLRDHEVDLNSLAASVRDIGIAVQSLTDRVSRAPSNSLSLRTLDAGSVQAAASSAEAAYQSGLLQAIQDQAGALTPGAMKLLAAGLDAQQARSVVDKIRANRSGTPGTSRKPSSS